MWKKVLDFFRLKIQTLCTYKMKWWMDRDCSVPDIWPIWNVTVLPVVGHIALTAKITSSYKKIIWPKEWKCKNLNIAGTGGSRIMIMVNNVIRDVLRPFKTLKKYKHWLVANFFHFFLAIWRQFHILGNICLLAESWMRRSIPLHCL